MSKTVSMVEELNKLHIAAKMDIQSLIPILDLIARRKEYAAKMLHNINYVNEEDEAIYYEMLDSYNKNIKQLLGL